MFLYTCSLSSRLLSGYGGCIVKLDKIKIKMLLILVLLIPNFIIDFTHRIHGVIEEVEPNIIEILMYGSIYEKIDVLVLYTIGLLVICILLDLIRRDIKGRRL